jgi:ribose transport system substrate-binding protein
VIEVIGCDFRADRQVRALEALIERRPDAIISIPVDNVLTATAHRLVTHAGIKLVLMDNAPIGMLPGKDYVSLVSADNFGNGQVAASILSDDIPEGGVVGILGFGVDFFVTNEREIAFRKWLRQYRPDVRVEHAEFPDIESAGDVAVDFLEGHGDIDGLFVVWDEPAIQVVSALRETGQELPITTIDLGNEAAVEIASGGMIKGVGAQQPYDQGAAEAMAAIMALVGEQPPPWVALPSLSVTKRNVLSAYEAVWHTPAPNELRGVIESAT